MRRQDEQTSVEGLDVIIGGGVFAERMFVRKELRELSFLLQDANQRYETALASFPPDIERVPQHLLASYLGITPESLSRLKRKR